MRVCVCVRTVSLAPDGTLGEVHDVLCECAGLVRKDVVDLSEFFVQRCGASLGWRVAALMIHQSVPVNVVTVPQTDYLHTEHTQHTHFKFVLMYHFSLSLKLFVTRRQKTQLYRILENLNKHINNTHKHTHTIPDIE